MLAEVAVLALTRCPDDPDIFHGMSIGLQIVGRRFEDERVVEIVKSLQGLFE